MSFVSSRLTPPPPPGRRHGWHFRPPGNALCKEEIAPRKAPWDSWSTGLCDPLCIHKKAKKEKPVSSHLDRTSLVKDLLYGQKENFSCGAIAGNPARAYLTRLSYQSEGSLRAGSPFGGYRKTYTREWHARGDATKPQHSLHLAHSRIKPYNETPGRMHWGAGARRLKKKTKNTSTNAR